MFNIGFIALSLMRTAGFFLSVSLFSLKLGYKNEWFARTKLSPGQYVIVFLEGSHQTTLKRSSVDSQISIVASGCGSKVPGGSPLRPF